MPAALRRISPARRCACGAPVQTARGPARCEGCKTRRRAGRERERSVDRPSSAAQGYGAEHKALRRRWSPAVATGRVECARCGLPIAAGTSWDLGHVDGDRSRYAGPEHAACNRGTRGLDRQRPSSRRW